MKANDNIPEDEMLLAEAIAAAKADGLAWTRHTLFLDRNNFYVPVSRTLSGWDVPRVKKTACCAAGALILAGHRDLPADFESSITKGNDYDAHEMTCVASTASELSGESLGWAFRCAMTQEDS